MGWGSERAYEFIQDSRGKAFDPNLVDLFLESYDEFMEIGKKYDD